MWFSIFHVLEDEKEDGREKGKTDLRITNGEVLTNTY